MEDVARLEFEIGSSPVGMKCVDMGLDAGNPSKSKTIFVVKMQKLETCLKNRRPGSLTALRKSFWLRIISIPVKLIVPRVKAVYNTA